MKQNLILKTALAVALGSVATSAFAGVASPLPKTFASPMFAAASKTAPAIAIAPVSYATAVALSPNTTYYVYVKLNNGAQFATSGAGVPTAAMLAITDVTGTNRLTAASPNTITVAAPTVSTDGTFVVYPVSIAAGQNPLQINSTITFTAAASTVVNVGSLATPGSSITASVVIGGSSSSTALPASSNVVDSLSTGTVANSALPVAASIVASDASAFIASPFVNGATINNYGGQIDAVTAKAQLVTNPTPHGDIVTNSTSIVDFGGINIQPVPNVFGLDGVTPYVVSNAATGPQQANGGLVPSSLNFAVSGQFGAFTNNNVASNLGLWLDTTPACSTAAPGIVGVLNTNASSAAFGTSSAGINNLGTGTVVAANNNISYLCGSVDGKTVITPTEPSIASLTFTDGVSGKAFTVTPTLTNGSAAETTGLYYLNFNGGIAVTPIYIGKAGNGFGNFYVRVINTGYTNTPVTLSVINDATGKTGSQSGVVTTSSVPYQSTPVSGGISIPAQGAIVLSTSDIENIIGTVPSTSMPRLMFTAPTNLAVQTYVLTSQGAFSELDPVTGLTR